MSGPTREELSELSLFLREEARAPDRGDYHGTRCDRAAQLIDAYPLPPEGGELAELADLLDRIASEGGQWIDEVRVHRAAALLRQPPAAGVDREAGRWHYQPELPAADGPYLIAEHGWAEIARAWWQRDGFRFDPDDSPLGDVYAWCPAPAPPPLPETEAAARQRPVTNAELTED